MEIVRAHILKPGITLQGQPTEVGQTVEFSDQRGFTTPDGSSLLLQGRYSGNAVDGKLTQRQRVEPMPSALALSQRLTPRLETAVTKFSWGTNPNTPAQRDFGTTDPSLQAEYLGHPLRDVMEATMDGQTEDFDPTRIIPFSNHTMDYQIIFAGRVADAAQISGIEDSVQMYDHRQGPEFTFPGEVMMGAYLSLPRRHYETPVVTLFAATTATEDDLVRVQSAPPIAVSRDHPYTLHALAQSLAEVSLFSQLMVPEHHPELGEEFPLLIVEHLQDELSMRATTGRGPHPNRWKIMQENHGLFWPDVVDALPKDEVMAEKDRLIDVFKSAAFQ